MIIEFRVKNFRSFKGEQIFSMVADNYAQHADTNTFNPGLKGFDERLLRSAAVYGANAAGKTNLLCALQFMQILVLNSANPTNINQYTPFKFASAARNAPSEFVVTFIQNGIRYEYGFTLNAKRIEKEWLIEFVNPRGREMFRREWDQKKQDYEWHYSSYLKGSRKLWSSSTRPQSLFLSIAFQLNSQQLAPVFEWFRSKLVIIVGEIKFNAFLTLSMLDEPQGKEAILSFMQEADFGITDLEVKREPLPPGAVILGGGVIIEHKPGQAAPNSVRVTLSHKSDHKEHASLPLEEESHGTQTFFKSAGAFKNVLRNGEVLLFDEIEASFHPLLVRFLIKLFHSGNNNKNSQLIFTTHSTELLDQESLLRRDQIWFVAKDKDGSSRIYPLTEFKPREKEALQRGYLRGNFGALPILP